MTLAPPATTLILPGKVLVTGASGGIGRAVARRLSEAGVAVIATDVRPALDAEPPGTTFVPADITRAADRDRLMAAAGTGIGGIVHAAGIIDATHWSTIDEVEFDRILAVNLKAPFLLTRALLGAVSDEASIVLVGSIAARRASPGALVYAATKAAVHSLGASLSVALAGRGIRVNMIAPGLIDTPMTDRLNLRLAGEAGRDVEQVAAERAMGIPAGRLGTPEDVAETCLFLLSRQAAYVSGSTLFATGGVLAGAI